MSLNKICNQTGTGSQSWMNINAKSLTVDGVSVESEKIYEYNISPNSVGLEVWKIIETDGTIYARFSGSRNYTIAAGLTNPTVIISTPPTFSDKYVLSSTGPVGVISATMSLFGTASVFGISSVDHAGTQFNLYFTSDSSVNPRPSIVSFDILYPVIKV